MLRTRKSYQSRLALTATLGRAAVAHSTPMP